MSGRTFGGYSKKLIRFRVLSIRNKKYSNETGRKDIHILAILKFSQNSTDFIKPRKGFCPEWMEMNFKP